MLLRPEDVRIYSRNKNILFEPENEGNLFSRLIAKIGVKLSRLNDSPGKAVISERIIEYPVIFQIIDRKSKNILDFGCAEDLFPIHLSSLGYRVTGLDYRSYPFTHPNFSFIHDDILNWQPPEEKYDCAISISTIEHVGLGGYRDPLSENGDSIAVQKLLASLKKGGQLIISVPFGKHTIERKMRIYNREKLSQLVPHIEMERFFFKPDRYANWTETSWHEINELEYEDYYKLAPAQGLAVVSARKP